MLTQLQTTPSRLSRPARVALAALAIAALVSPLVYLSRTGAIMADDPDKTIKPPVEEFLPSLSYSEKKISAELEKHAQFDFVETPLHDVVVFLKDKHSLEIQLDDKALEEAGVGSDTPVSCKVKGISLRSALRLLLRPLDLAFVIDDEVLLITTTEVADMRLFTRTYPIGDLIGDNDYDSLIEVITTTVRPQTWDEVGGPGAISEMSAAGSLVISQTQDVHAEVLQLLQSLRAAREAGGPALLKTLAAQAKEQAKKGRMGTGGLKGGAQTSAGTGGGVGGLKNGGDLKAPAKPTPPAAEAQNKSK